MRKTFWTSVFLRCIQIVAMRLFIILLCMYAAAALAAAAVALAAAALAATALAATALAAAARMRSKGKTCEQRRKRTIARSESKQQTAKCRKGRSRKSRIIGGLPAEAKTKVESKGQTAKAAHTEG